MNLPIENLMPIDAITAMAHARANLRHISEAKDSSQLNRLKTGAIGYNQSLLLSGAINQDQLSELSSELEAACQSWIALHP
ncbi:hypothetical protein [Pseudomonas sp. MPR-ANC1]|uniref:hypothetical protein n=2 Tax=unclassified Pseudomonas TaxID=196821 RepID=UPI0011AF7A6F|nr:hypothetical protein [Pseudomonas sp. MPR-ANC1]